MKFAAKQIDELIVTLRAWLRVMYFRDRTRLLYLLTAILGLIVCTLWLQDLLVAGAQDPQKRITMSVIVFAMIMMVFFLSTNFWETFFVLRYLKILKSMKKRVEALGGEAVDKKVLNFISKKVAASLSGEKYKKYRELLKEEKKRLAGEV